MFLKTQLRRYAVEWIEKLSRGKLFTPSDVYAYLKTNFGKECDEAGYTPDGLEPKYQKDARWAIQDCKFRHLIRWSHHAHWQRI